MPLRAHYKQAFNPQGMSRFAMTEKNHEHEHEHEHDHEYEHEQEHEHVHVLE